MGYARSRAAHRAVVVCITPLATVLVYALGLAAFVASIELMQASPDARLMVLPNGFSITFVSIALSFLLYVARRRDYAQGRLIDRQRAELSTMNADLEGRVRTQVAEIVARAREIETLNAQLRAQVRSRSTELSIALAKLARARDEAGHLKKGVVLGERFEIDALLGEGGMGAVYSGVDRSTGTSVAIKVIQATSAQQLDALHRFLCEARAVAQVAHPAVVQMFHVDVSADGLLFQVQELVLGETLHSRLRERTPWEPANAARLASVLCDALAAAHAAGVIHRDVKPGNMMLTKATPGLKLLDFGISKLLRMQARDSSSAAGKLVGTPAYMAPEYLEGHGLTDRADVYAVGVILFLMLTGRYPFDDATTHAAMLANVRDAAPDVRTLHADAPVALADLVARCLARNPTERPASHELARALGEVADAGKAPPLEALARDALASGPPDSLTGHATKVEGKSRRAHRAHSEPSHARPAQTARATLKR